MNLSKELQSYLAIRRNLGYKLNTEERILKRYISFLEEKCEAYLKTDLFLQWMQVFGKASQNTWARRLGVIRLFASWLYTLDPGHEIPPQSLIPSHYRRQKPYIYSDDEIRSIIETAGLLPSTNGVRAITYSTFFGLISVTGLRISEAISLNDKDVDLENGIITLHNGKNGNNRILPIAECTTIHLKEYARKRNRLLEYTPVPFFVSDEGGRLTDCTTRYNFAVVCQMIGMRAAQRYNKHGVGPRIHDLRHTFAVKVIMNWYKEGKDIDQEMLKLINYLGHNKVTHTYWYIEAIPELMALAAQRADHYMMKEVQS